MIGKISLIFLLLSANKVTSTNIPSSKAIDESAPKMYSLLSSDKVELVQYLLNSISDWIMTLDVGSNVLNNSHATTINRSIFINGNLARVLLASHKIQNNATRLQEGLRWCDSFCNLQKNITTSRGTLGGYWDTGYSEVYIADTGTA